MLWNKICAIFDVLNKSIMSTEVRIITLNGKDVGVRENSRGEMYMDKKIYFTQPRIVNAVTSLKAAGLVKRNKKK